MESFVEHALSKCPFLHVVADLRGDDAARSLAARPFGNSGFQGPILEESYDFDTPFSLVHGPRGAIPLDLSGSRNGGKYPYRTVKPDSDSNTAPEVKEKPSECSNALTSTSQSRPVQPDPMCSALRNAPLASISLSGGFLGGDGWPWSKKQKKQQRRNQRRNEPQKRSQPDGNASHQPHAMKQVIQPLVALGLSKNGHLVCPPPVVWMRTQLAKTELCKALRPMDLPFKLAACGVLSGLANLPPGMMKEHFEKFSPGWFVAIHISIPFVAALRKAVVMPKFALVVTIAGAVAGQMIGGRIERKRLQHKQEQALALMRGERQPEDVPFLCATLKAIMNPWEESVA